VYDNAAYDVWNNPVSHPLLFCIFSVCTEYQFMHKALDFCQCICSKSFMNAAYPMKNVKLTSQLYILT
jgi:hypothetical protein